MQAIATENRKGIKALGLLSGGLDSTIAVKLMVNLGYDVTALNFMSPFCNCTKKKADSCKSAAHKVATEMNIPLKTLFMGEEYIAMLRAPRHGYGKGMNPCVDCRVMMFRQTKALMEEMGARFIFTGEVLSQRPMSQMKNKLDVIENESGLKGLIVRPLSAALLEPTIPERMGWINRDEMLSISGRSRKTQMELGRGMGMGESDFCSSGGCMLTDQHFAVRMKDLLGHTENTTVRETRLLRVGRHFRVSEDCKVIVGRNEGENEKLLGMAQEADAVVWVKDHKGPCVLVHGKYENGAAMLAAGIAVRYSDAPRDGEVEVEIGPHGADARTSVMARAISDAALDELRL